jgi:hypothetical protein
MEQVAKQILSKPPISAQAAGIRPSGAALFRTTFRQFAADRRAARDRLTLSLLSAAQFRWPVGIPNVSMAN